MLLRSVRLFGASALLFAALPANARSQAPAGDTTVPCRSQSCAIFFDWGSGKTAASYPSDRRYGSGDDFESRFRSVLAESGLMVKDSQASGPFTMTLRTTMRERVMCDLMSGTNTDMSCAAMGDVTITFRSSDAATKAPASVRVVNRCGAGDVFMTMPVFAKYAAEMVYYQLEGQAKKGQRPVIRC